MAERKCLYKEGREGTRAGSRSRVYFRKKPGAVKRKRSKWCCKKIWGGNLSRWGLKKIIQGGGGERGASERITRYDWKKPELKVGGEKGSGDRCHREEEKLKTVAKERSTKKGNKKKLRRRKRREKRAKRAEREMTVEVESGGDKPTMARCKKTALKWRRGSNKKPRG